MAIDGEHNPSSEGWDVFDYEVMMFRSLCGLLRAGNSAYARLDQCIKNAVTESALLHLRQVVEVLLSRGKWPDNIKLCSLLPGLVPSSLQELHRWYGSHSMEGTPCWVLNKMMAHPTGHRGAHYDYSGLIGEGVSFVEDVLREIDRKRTAPNPSKEA